MNRLFFDIETSPNIVLSWRIGYKLNIGHDNLLKERAIICIGYKWEKEKTARALTWDKNQGDKAMLAEFVEEVHKADEVVGHNGDKFDLPWIRARCAIHGIPMMPAVKTIDTLQWARRKFLFNSNRLDYLGKTLGVGGKIKTEFALWKRILLENDAAALREMVKYCKRDVEMLQRVYEKLCGYVPHKTHVAALQGMDKWCSPFGVKDPTKVRAKMAKVTAAGTRQQQMQCLTTGRYYTISAKDYSEYREAKDR